ncbi:hypothetical protein AAFF_G00141680 [Aldrovandia affinis]|uniref:Uncharacterized protein n=1 Tax=Aldrovandia affinis TaxID=143900 RepID=A0AAD7TCI0_9TELE|nr:hypothetical protein AAFF_G00141680 [Aldrovandia affinis]
MAAEPRQLSRGDSQKSQVKRTLEGKRFQSKLGLQGKPLNGELSQPVRSIKAPQREVTHGLTLREIVRRVSLEEDCGLMAEPRGRSPGTRSGTPPALLSERNPLPAVRGGADGARSHCGFVPLFDAWKGCTLLSLTRR